MDKLKRKVWKEKNKDKIRAWKRNWANSSNGKASQKRYRDKSPKALRFLYIQSAIRRGIVFDISEEEFAALINQDCVYCGQSAKVKRNGLDRKNNLVGYILKNVVPCCFRCNQMKGKLSVDDFLNHIVEVIDYAIK